MKQFLKRIWTSARQHPKTTLLGVAGATVQILNLAATAGVHVGKYGPMQFLQLGSALSTLVTGAWSHDPQPPALPSSATQPGN